MAETLASEITSRFSGTSLTILDVGCGTGTFTRRIKRLLEDQDVNASFFALDPTWHMLNELLKHDPEITCIVGVFERIRESIELNKKYRAVKAPTTFDVIISTLALHHLEAFEPAFKSTQEALNEDGWIFFCDTGPYNDPSHDETGHYGIDFNDLSRIARRYFTHVHVEKIADVVVKHDDLQAEMFMLSCTALSDR